MVIDAPAPQPFDNGSYYYHYESQSQTTADGSSHGASFSISSTADYSTSTADYYRYTSQPADLTGGQAAPPANNEATTGTAMPAASTKGQEVNATHFLPSPAGQVQHYQFHQGDSGRMFPPARIDGYILLDYVRGHLNFRLPARRAVRLFRQMTRCLQEVSSVGLPHRAVCLDNFVVQHDSWRVSILVHFKLHRGVVGARCVMADDIHFHELPQQYISPEALCQHVSSTSSSSGTADALEQPQLDSSAMDVYALGCCLFAMLTGRWLFKDEEERRLVHQGYIDQVLWAHKQKGLQLPGPCALDLICAMTQCVPSERPSLEQVLEHLWCTSMAHTS